MEKQMVSICVFWGCVTSQLFMWNRFAAYCWSYFRAEKYVKKGRVINLLGCFSFLKSLLIDDTTVGTLRTTSALEESADFGAPVIVIIVVVGAILLLGSAGDGGFPVGAHFFDALLVIELGIVRLVQAEHALPERQMARVDGDAVVFLLPAGADVRPATFLLLEIQTGGIRKEDEGDDQTGETEPGHDQEASLGADVVVQNGRGEGTEFTTGGGEAVSGSTDGSGEDLGSDEESGAVGAELAEERRQEVHGLETAEAGTLGVVVVVESRDDEADEVAEETDHLHPFAAVCLVIDEERGQVVTDEFDADIGEVPQPGDHDIVLGGGFPHDNLDKLGLEQFVAVEENIVGVPADRGGQKTAAEVSDRQLERLLVITGHGLLLLRDLELARCRLHLVDTVVDQPQGASGRDGKGDTVGPLRHDGAVGTTAATVEDEQENDENDLVEELTPALHQESRSDLSATVQTIFTGGDLAGAHGVFHTGGGGHGIFTTHTDAVEHKRQRVADDPAI